MTAAVLHVAQPTTEGVARCVADFVQHQVKAVPRDRRLPGRWLAGWLASAVAEAGAEHVRWNAGRGPGPAVPAETLRLARIIQSRRPDLVHLHSAKAGLAGRLAVRGALPTVYQPHG